jgi:putative nucleotidyltransferase with HDIG domain
MNVIAREVTDAVSGPPSCLDSELERLLAQGFGVPLTLVDGETGAVASLSSAQPKGEVQNFPELCRAVSRGGRPEFIGEEDPLIVLALPIIGVEGRSWVAMGTFLTRAIRPGEDFTAAARRLGLNPEAAAGWAESQTPWTAEMLLRVGQMVLDQIRLRAEVAKLKEESGCLSVHLVATYEEISLLHRLTQNLKISQSDEDLGSGALEWLEEVIPARGFALQLIPTPEARKSPTHGVRTAPLLLVRGDCPVDEDQFSALMIYLCEEKNFPRQPVVLNHPGAERADWPLPQIQQLVAVPLAEGENLFGWLAAFNHAEGEEFGTVEASMMNSVAAILGIHSGNIELYRQQSELLDGIVGALTSAIDAKDPYTCGHSDRVARIAARLAEELHCEQQTVHTVYLAGLLHDIGKIGVEDSVLRKPGKLSPEEYEHIKSHVEIGHHILHDLNKLKDVLPMVLHHHEAWNGGGYPQHLDCQNIPLAARILSVADAFDAMSSDRPYRCRLSEEKIIQILRDGAGKQWDPEVVTAFFQALDDIRRIIREKSR